MLNIFDLWNVKGKLPLFCRQGSRKITERRMKVHLDVCTVCLLRLIGGKEKESSEKETVLL